MSDVPGEGSPIDQREAAIAALEQRFATMAEMLGVLASEMVQASQELSVLRGGTGGEVNGDGADISVAPLLAIVEPYSGAEADAKRSQAEYERLSELNGQFPDRIQDIFAPTIRGFEGVMQTKASLDDPRASRLSVTRKSPDAMPSYDPEDTSEWDRFVGKHARRHEWQEEADTFKCTYNIDYVRLSDGRLKMVGYGFDRTPNTTPASLKVGGKRVTSSTVNVTVAEGLARKAHVRTFNVGFPVDDMRLDFDHPCIKQGEGFGGKASPYNAEEYRFDNPHGAPTPAGDVLDMLSAYMATMPSK